MDFNVTKCFLLTVTLKRNPSHYDYQLFNNTLARVNSHPYLGVEIDSKLTWTPQVNSMTAKASRTLGLLRRTLKSCSPQVKETAYKMLVRPKLEYGSTTWNPHTDTQVNKIESIQRKAARFVVNDHRRTTSVTGILNHLTWETLEMRRLKQQLSMLFKIKNSLVNITLPPNLHIPTIQTRNSSLNKFILPMSRVNAYQFSFYPRTVRVWNSLPAHIVCLTSLTSFQGAVGQLPLAAPAYLPRY